MVARYCSGYCHGGCARSMALVLQQRQRHQGVPQWRSLVPVLQAFQHDYSWRAPDIGHAGAQNRITALYVNHHADVVSMVTENSTICHMEVVPDPSRSGRPMLISFDEQPIRRDATVTSLSWAKTDAHLLDLGAYSTLGAASSPGAVTIFKKPQPGAPQQQLTELTLPRGNAWAVEWSRNACGWLAFGSDDCVILRDLNASRQVNTWNALLSHLYVFLSTLSRLQSHLRSILC